MGDHTLFGHGNSLYLESLHVPLLVIYPSQLPANVEVAQPVSLRDIPQTIFDLVSMPAPQDIPGESFARYLREPESYANSPSETILAEVYPGPDFVGPISRGEMKSLVNEEYQYILNGDGVEEMYDYKDDAAEVVNLASVGDNEDKIGKFRASLTCLLTNSRNFLTGLKEIQDCQK
jgi:arylsulfatase A-like enzyme